MKPSIRHFHIDVIRGTGILLMILTHVLSWHFGSKALFATWNAIHLVVVGLVFCSAYLYAKANADEKVQHKARWFIKRVLRLYIPFILYLAIHYTLWYLFPSWVRGYGIQRSIPFVLSSLTLTGGVDIGWLTTLFVQLAILSPFLLFVSRNPKKRNALIIFLLLYSTITAFFRIPMEYTRLTGWIPWSLITILGFMYSDVEKKSRAQKILIGSVVFFVAFYVMLTLFDKSLLFTNHKYPPDLYYLSYGTMYTFCILVFFQYIQKIASKFQRFITFVSRQSYTIFFVHIIVLDIVMTRMPSNWIFETLSITSITLLITFCISRAIARRRLSQ
jgi:fucose 4-O-acetylase-like acetyltransferase